MKKTNGRDLIAQITLEDIQKSIGAKVSFGACVHKIRNMSGFAFVVLRTGGYIFQSVYTPVSYTHLDVYKRQQRRRIALYR